MDTPGSDILPLEFDVIDDCIQFVTAAHAGRLRLDGTLERFHLLEVASRVVAAGYVDTLAVLVALLHDVVEDTAVSLLAIHDAFGPEVAEAVELLTQQRGESRGDYLARCFGAGDELVAVVKFCDRIANVAGLQLVPNLPAMRDHIEQYLWEYDTYFVGAAVLVPEPLANELAGLMARVREYFTTGIVIEFPSGAKLARVK